MRHLFAASLLGLVACGDGGGAGPSDAVPAQVAGSWEASAACSPECHFTLVRLDDPDQSLDLVSIGGIFLLNITRSGSFELTSPTTGTTIGGTAEAEGSLLILRDNAGAQDTADWSVSGQHLELSFRGVTEQLDFDGDDIGDPATIRSRFRRR